MGMKTGRNCIFSVTKTFLIECKTFWQKGIFFSYSSTCSRWTRGPPGPKSRSSRFAPWSFPSKCWRYRGHAGSSSTWDLQRVEWISLIRSVLKNSYPKLSMERWCKEPWRGPLYASSYRSFVGPWTYKRGLKRSTNFFKSLNLVRWRNTITFFQVNSFWILLPMIAPFLAPW